MARKIHAMPEIREVEVYTAAELQQVNPRGFEKAFQDWDLFMWDSGIAFDDVRLAFDWVLEKYPTVAQGKPEIEWDISYTQRAGVSIASGFSVTTAMARELGVDVPPVIASEGVVFNVWNNSSFYANSFSMGLSTDDLPYWSTWADEQWYYDDWYKGLDEDGEAIPVPDAERQAAEKYENDLLDALRDLCGELMSAARDATDYTEEHFIENAEINEMMFYEDGSIAS